MLPIFLQPPTNPAMALHAMKAIQKAVAFLCPNQTPVATADQPLYTIAKKLQWRFPNSEIGENSFLVMLGAMHTEKMLWGVSGNWLDGSGWTTALTNSGVTTSGKAESFIGVHHICRTRYIHQVSVCALYELMSRAYDSDLKSENQLRDCCKFDQWLLIKRTAQPQAEFWLLSWELDLIILMVRIHCLIILMFQLIYTLTVCEVMP